MNFENKVVLVTGSGSGMGKATAIQFAKEGADVVIVDWNEDTANNTAEECKRFTKKVLVIKADVSNTEDVKKIIESTVEEFGKIDVLVNNAGIIREGKILTGDIMDTFDEIINTNLRSVVNLTSLATPYLIKSKGCVVNTSSVVSKMEQAGRKYPVYTIAKSGVDTFTRLSALELGPLGVRVNAVNPGPVNTNLMKNAGLKHTFEEFGKIGTVLGRCSDPHEIADLIVFLASDKAKSITGSTCLVDNGSSLM